jgi:hypothetical protein
MKTYSTLFTVAFISMPVAGMMIFAGWADAAVPPSFDIVPNNGAGDGHTKDTFFIKGVSEGVSYGAEWSITGERSSCIASGAWSGNKPSIGSEQLVIPSLNIPQALTYTLTCPLYRNPFSSQVLYLIPDIRTSNDSLKALQSELKNVSIQNLNVDQRDTISLTFDVIIGQITGVCNNLHQNVGFDVLVDGEPVLFRTQGSAQSARRIIYEEMDHATVKRLAVDPLALESGSHTLAVRVSFGVLHGTESRRVMGRFADSQNNILPRFASTMSFALAASDKLERQVQFSVERPAPHPPSNVTALYICSPEDTRTVIHWTDNAYNEDGFRVYRRRASESSFAVVATLGEDTETFTDRDVGAPGVYVYKIEAFNAVGSAMSEETSVSAGTCVQGDFTISSDFKIITMLQPFPEAGTSFSSPIRFKVRPSGGFHDPVQFSVANITAVDPRITVQDISPIFEPDDTLMSEEYGVDTPVRFRVGISARTRAGSYVVLVRAQDPSGTIVRTSSIKLDIVEPTPGR